MGGPEVILVLLALLTGCARQGYPPGGPVDKTGPMVLGFSPAKEAVNVDPRISPWIVLNEYPDRGSIESAVFISPEPEGGFEIKVHRKRIAIDFNDPIPDRRTIVITFGTGIKDRYGNPMAESFVLAFSTGMTVDNAQIDGYIDNLTNPGDTWVWGYPLELFEIPDPRADKAPFAVQPDVTGSFALTHLPPGSYRLFAVVDSRRNRLWDPEREAFAIPSRDCEALEVRQPRLNLQMAGFDLIPPDLRGVEAVHRQGLRISFSEPVLMDDVQITTTLSSGQELVTIDAYQNPADPAAVMLTTGLQRQDSLYQIRFGAVCDTAGNVADSLAGEFTGTARPDTTGPRFTWSDPENGAGEVPLDYPLRVGFSESITTTTLNAGVVIRDDRDSLVTGRWSFPGSALGQFEPDAPLQTNTGYLVTITGDSIRDVFDNVSPDSLLTFGFTTQDLEATGSLSGRVLDAPPGLRIIARQLGTSDVTWSTAADETGNYRFERLPAAKYLLWLYQDLDGNRQHSPGSIDPFSFAEPFVVSEDTIRVRSRWETEGIILHWAESAGIGEILNR